MREIRNRPSAVTGVLRRLPSLLRTAEKALLPVLFPGGLACLICREPAHGRVICPACAAHLEEIRIRGNICPECGAEADGGECRRCSRFGRVRARSVWPYTDAAAILVRRLKDDSAAEAAEPMCDALAELARSLSLPEDTVVTWVTMPEKRRKQRGIDHGRLLAEGTAARLGLSCRQLLLRTAEGSLRTQRGLSGEQRVQNMRNAFCCQGKMPSSVLLVDDVLTTGATANACTQALRQGGTGQVMVITAARADR